jgi:rhomboid family GlyGly-CTERM serine protease
VAAGRDWLWLALLCLAPLLLPESAPGWLEYRREEILSGELWRLFSGHWVHYSARHAIQGGIALAVLAYVLDGERRLLRRLLLIAPLLSGFLLFATPDMVRYRGASALVMALAGILLSTLWTTRPAWRFGVAAIALVLCGKILADALGVGGDLVGLPDGVRVAWEAHAAGLALGLLAEKLSGRVAA